MSNVFPRQSVDRQLDTYFAVQTVGLVEAARAKATVGQFAGQVTIAEVASEQQSLALVAATATAGEIEQGIQF